MLYVFRNNEELNNIFNEFYKKAQEEDIEDIDVYLSDIENNIFSDFEMIKSICKSTNNKVSLKICKIYLQNFLYNCMGVNKKSYYKPLYNSTYVEELQSEQDKYYTNFIDNFDEFEMTLIHSLKQYYKIVKELGDEEDLREIYAIYQSVGLYIINMLPDSYRKVFLNDESFDELNYVDYKMKNTSKKYIVNIDRILRNYIKEKYKVDLFDYTYSEQRKRVISEKD